jgi:hypothetical protein
MEVRIVTGWASLLGYTAGQSALRGSNSAHPLLCMVFKGRFFYSREI